MKNIKPSSKSTKYGTFISSMIILPVAVAHIFLPEFGYKYEVIKNIDIETLNHFYYLGTYAICSMLFFIVILSLLSLRLDISVPELKKIRVWFLALSLILWICRLVLELIYPVNLSLFIVEKPHNYLLIAFVVIVSGTGADLYNTLRYKSGGRYD